MAGRLRSHKPDVRVCVILTAKRRGGGDAYMYHQALFLGGRAYPEGCWVKTLQKFIGRMGIFMWADVNGIQVQIDDPDLDTLQEFSREELPR